MSERDPRVDPMPGDSIAREFVTALGGCIIREVERAHGGFVGFYRDNGHRRKWKIITLDDWRRWAARSEILESAAATVVRQAQELK
jgi:hypothetical protein